jgi:MoaA/NifB/PqqE/SkfB family radical SAM enzyme
MTNAIPARVCFNFTRRCNMQCPYCYIPFGDQKSDLRVWKKIVDRVVEWHVEAITFGGGDPFMYGQFRDLLLYCFGKLFIHVDTNGINLKDPDFELMQKGVALLGLPVDGSNAAVHGVMRDDLTHFKSVIHNIVRTNKYGLRLTQCECCHVRYNAALGG